MPKADIRLVLLVTPDQRRQLKMAAAALGITMSELVRRWIDEHTK